MQAALHELAAARHVLRQVEAQEAQRQLDARRKASELGMQQAPNGWVPQQQSLSLQQAQQQRASMPQQSQQQSQAQQQQQQQMPPLGRGLHPEVNALAQQWFGWDSPVLQSSVESATTHQRANNLPAAI